MFPHLEGRTMKPNPMLSLTKTEWGRNGCQTSLNTYLAYSLEPSQNQINQSPKYKAVSLQGHAMTQTKQTMEVDLKWNAIEDNNSIFIFTPHQLLKQVGCACVRELE